jgi:hypothetical protein
MIHEHQLARHMSFVGARLVQDPIHSEVVGAFQQFIAAAAFTLYPTK